MEKKCVNCAGSGQLVLMNSGFKSDGYRRKRCGICAGTGSSDYQPSPDVVQQQKTLRAAFAAFRATA